MTFAFDEQLWFGRSDDSQAEQAAIASMAATVGRVIGAKPFPVAARRLAELTRSPNAEIDPAIRVLESDPALVARLLKLVNSSGFALKFRCTSVRHAAVLVGVDRLHHLASTAAILDLFDARSGAAVEVLRHAASVGAIARYLGAHLSLPTEELFTIGFLHDLGKLMLLETEGDSYAELLAAYAGQADALHHEERQRYGFDHAVLAAHVLSAWGIPEPVPRTVAWHHDVARAYAHGARSAALVSALRLADALAHALEHHDRSLIAELGRSEAASYLDVSEAQLDAMWPDLARLCERSRTGVGSEEGAPRVDSLMPGSRRSGTPSTAPRQLSCVVCEGPSFGNTCEACLGHVCPDHQIGREAWCQLCTREYRDDVEARRVPRPVLQIAGGLATLAVLGSALRASLSGASVALAVVGPVVALAFIGVVAATLHRWWVRREFLRTRPNRYAPAEPSPALDHTASWPEPSAGDTLAPPALIVDSSIQVIPITDARKPDTLRPADPEVSFRVSHAPDARSLPPTASARTPRFEPSEGGSAATDASGDAGEVGTSDPGGSGASVGETSDPRSAVMPRADLRVPDLEPHLESGSRSLTDGAASGADGAVSGADGAVSGADGAASGADGAVSGADGAVSGADGAASGADGAASGADGAASGADGAVSGADGAASAADGAATDEESDRITDVGLGPVDRPRTSSHGAVANARCMTWLEAACAPDLPEHNRGTPRACASCDRVLVQDIEPASTDLQRGAA